MKRLRLYTKMFVILGTMTLTLNDINLLTNKGCITTIIPKIEKFENKNEKVKKIGKKNELLF